MLNQIKNALRKTNPVSRTLSMREPRSTKSDDMDSDDSLPKTWAKRVSNKTYAVLFSVNFTFISLPFFPSWPCNAIASVRWNSVNTGYGNATDGVTVRRDSTLLPFKEIHAESRAYNSFPRCSECFHYYFSHFVSPNEQYGQELCNLLYKY